MGVGVGLIWARVRVRVRVSRARLRRYDLALLNHLGDAAARLAALLHLVTQQVACRVVRGRVRARVRV